MNGPPTGRWIPANHTTRIPRNFIFLDSEAKITKTDDGETHTFRCAVTAFDTMSRKSNRWLPTQLQVHETAEHLWRSVTDRCKPRERTVMVAHNAGYDLRITQAFTLWRSFGWEVERLSLQPGALWVTVRRGSSTLVVVDSLTWLPHSLDKIGKAIGMEKLSLPRNDAGDDEWVERCTSDVAILRTAFLRCVRWLRDNDLGNWRPTGAGMAWSAWRHRHITHRILAHGDRDIRDRERRAAWTGRAESFRFGRQVDGPFTEWDYRCCYATIARDCEVPTRLVGEVHGADVQALARMGRTSRVLADVVVETGTPTVPTVHDGRIVWPVGRFRTTLWDCELELAVENGASVEVERAWKYRRAPALKQWAEWVLGLVDAPPGEVDPVVQMLAKHWSRALIGRFGSRFPTWEPYGDALSDGARLSKWMNGDTGQSGQMLELGGKSWLASEMTDHPHSAPQVMSWIAAMARVWLWRAMVAAGPSNVLYVDTDSLIVNPSGNERLTSFIGGPLRRKASYQSIELLGARRLVIDHKIRASGVPRDATRSSPRSWRGETWSSVLGDLSTGRSGTVSISERTVTFRDRDSRRRRLPGGNSEPWVLTL